MKMLKTLAILTVVATVGAGLANAQGGPPPDDQQQGGPPPAGPGGPGGQMQFGGPRRMMGGGPMLLMAPEVQKELKLTDDQIQKLRELMPRPPMRGENGDQQGQQTPPPRMNPQEMDKKVQDILTADQYTRLKQIRLQMQGPMAFMRPEIAQKLGLTDDQKDQIRAVFDKERPSGPPPNPGDGADFRKTMAERRARIEKGVMAVLSDDQKKTWQGMVGEPFKMPMMGPGFGGPRGFGPGGPGGPGGDRQGGPGGGPGGPGGPGQGGNPPPPPPDDGGGN